MYVWVNNGMRPCVLYKKNSNVLYYPLKFVNLILSHPVKIILYPLFPERWVMFLYYPVLPVIWLWNTTISRARLNWPDTLRQRFRWVPHDIFVAVICTDFKNNTYLFIFTLGPLLDMGPSAAAPFALAIVRPWQFLTIRFA